MIKGVSARFLVCCAVFLLAMAACTSDEDPSPAPTPTKITSGFRGPVLGGSGVSEEEAACSEEGGCVQTDDGPVDMDSSPLPLVQQAAGFANLGIPEGYGAIILEDEVLIRAISPDTLGGFTVSLREVQADQLAQMLERFGQPDFADGTPIQGAALSGTVLPTGEYGVIALLTAEDGREIFVEAYAASPAYWEAFKATFDAMLASLTL